METTQTKSLAAFTREFSPIEGLQVAHCVQYDLECADGGVRVLIRQTGPGGQNVFACRLRGHQRGMGVRACSFFI